MTSLVALYPRCLSYSKVRSLCASLLVRGWYGVLTPLVDHLAGTWGPPRR